VIEFCLDQAEFLLHNNSTAGDSEFPADIKAFDSTLGTHGGWESEDMTQGGSASVFSSFNVFLDFDEDASNIWTEGDITSISGVMELDLLSTDLGGNNRQIVKSDFTVDSAGGSTTVSDDSDFEFSNTTASAHTVTLPFTIDLTGEGITSPIEDISMFFSANEVSGLNVLNAGVVRFYDLCITIEGDPELVAPIKVSAFATNVTSNGLERLVVGTEDGEIFLLDQGNPGYAYQGQYIPWTYSLTMNPFFADAPFLNIKYNEVMVHMKTAGRENIEGFSGVNFLLPDENEMKDSISIGNDTTEINVDRIPSRVSTHLPNVTDGFSLSISGTTEGYPAHIIQALTYKITGLSDANRQPKTY